MLYNKTIQVHHLNSLMMITNKNRVITHPKNYDKIIFLN